MSKTTSIDSEVIKQANKYGKENPHLFHLGATKARTIRSNTLTLVFEARAKQAKKHRIASLKEVLRLEKLLIKDYKFPAEEKKHEAHLKRIVHKLKQQYRTLIPKLKAKYSVESKEEERWKFIERMSLMRAQDEQVQRFTHSDAADLLIKLSTLSGSKAKLKDLREKKEKKKTKPKVKEEKKS